jgi:hypothetical protein
MPISKGVSKRVAYKKEAGGWGVLAGNTGAKYLRRVTADFTLTKDAYESNEIRTDYQISDFRHGVKSVDGSLNGEFSPGSYSDFIASVVAKDFVSVAPVSSLSLTIAASGQLYTVTRAAGSWLTDGFEVGNIVRLSGGTLDTNTVGNNLLVVSLTALALTVRVLNGSTLVAQSAITGCTATVQGKKTFAPLTGHTDDSYTVEEWYSDILQSEVYTGNKVGSVAFQLPSTGLSTIDITFQGKDLTQKGTTQYFTSPTAAGTTGIFAAVNGAVIVNGVPAALITSADLTIERGLEAATVVGSNTAADIFTGRIRVSGNISVYFQDATYRDYFVNESEVAIVFALSSDNSNASNAVSFVLPRVKLGSSGKSDTELGLITQHSFTALLNSVTAAGLPATTIQIQDTAA